MVLKQTVRVTSDGDTVLTPGVGSDTWLDVGPVSMVFTGMLVSMCARRGDFALRDDMGAALGQPDVGATVLDTLRHRAGFSRWPGPLAAGNDPYVHYDASALAGDVQRLEETLTGTPGEVNVSPFGYVLLGEVVRRYAGGFATALKEFIAEPCGAAVAVEPGWRVSANVNALGAPVSRWTVPEPVVPAMGVWATAEGMRRFLDAVFVEKSFGAPSSAWLVSSSGLWWCSGATRNSVTFAGGAPSGAWSFRWDNGRPFAMTMARELRHLYTSR